MDIFDCQKMLPRSVVILAPGPGAAGWRRNYGDYVIAVNAAINIGVCDWWMVADQRCAGRPWWPEHRLAARHTLFSVEAGDADYTFAQGEPMGPGNADLRYGYLRPNATIVGQALQFAYWFGAARATLVGVDMRGDSYYNGDQVPEYADRDVWPYVATLNAHIAALRGRGMVIESATPTALQCSRYNQECA